MGQNHFLESLVEVMLSWMRWLTSWFWSIVNSEGLSGGFLSWFSNNWISLAVFLIVVGVIVDWLIWMIRWRPYWLWLRKRQIIYEEVTVRRKKRRPAPSAAPAADEYDDPFAAPQSDPYAQPPEDDLSDWDSQEDPYAQSASGRTAPEPLQKKVDLNHSRPVVLRERMNHTNVDDGQ